LAKHVSLSTSPSSSALYLFNFGGQKDPRKEQLQAEQMRIQAEILARRKNPKAKEELVKKVDERREKVAAKVGSTSYTKIKDEEDPLKQWQSAKKKGLIKELGYKAVGEERGVTSILGFSVPLILSPIDRPEMDNGERFDLRLPYAERGYVDEDDKSFSNMFSGLFGGGGDKKKPQAVSKDEKKESKKKRW